MCYNYHEMVSYMFHHLCIFITIECLKLINGDFSLSCKDKKKLGITQEKGIKCCNSIDWKNKCRGSGGNSLHLVNDPNPRYAHDHMVLLESKKNFSMFIWVQLSMMFVLIGR